MAGQGLSKIRLWDFSFAVCHSALRFDPCLSLASSVSGQWSRFLFTSTFKRRRNKLKQVIVELRCGGRNVNFRERENKKQQELQ